MSEFSQKPVLVVDLDGTLLRSDMLYETFWSAFGRDWKSPFTSLNALLKGKASLKRHLAQAGDLDVALLPFDEGVIDYITTWRAGGGQAVLVTATDETIARQIGEHLGLFDAVYGSDGVRNLKGPNKAEFLKTQYAEGAGFAYMGDTKADLPVWEAAAQTITVNLPAALKAQVDRRGGEIEHLTTVTRSIRPYIKAIRPHQWLKNVLAFLPMLAAHQYDGMTFLFTVLAFIAFSMVASSAYVFNDLLDLSADRVHPRKKLRPFASGAVPIAHGTVMGVGLLGLGLAIGVYLGPAFFAVIAVYYVITTAYSLDLKRRTVIDICTLASLYTLRIVAGGAAAGIPLSVWLLAFSLFFFLSLAAVKRQAELIDTAKRGKLDVSGRGYQVDDLPLITQIAISAGYVSVLVMALYVNSPAVIDLYTYPIALWGVCLILLYWITRIVMITHRGRMDDDPVVFGAKDRVSQICFVVMLACALGGALL